MQEAGSTNDDSIIEEEFDSIEDGVHMVSSRRPFSQFSTFPQPPNPGAHQMQRVCIFAAKKLRKQTKLSRIVTFQPS
jgi:hypothetical protein